MEAEALIVRQNLDHGGRDDLGVLERPCDHDTCSPAGVYADAHRALHGHRAHPRVPATRAAAAASLCFACQGGPTDRPIVCRKASIFLPPSAAVASRNTCSRSYQYTDQPRASAAVAKASLYITESATFAARVSTIRSSVVGGSS